MVLRSYAKDEVTATVMMDIKDHQNGNVSDRNGLGNAAPAT